MSQEAFRTLGIPPSAWKISPTDKFKDTIVFGDTRSKRYDTSLSGYLRTFDHAYNSFPDTFRRLQLQNEPCVVDAMDSWGDANYDMFQRLQKGRFIIVGRSDKRPPEYRDAIEAIAGSINDVDTWLELYKSTGGFNTIDLFMSRPFGGYSNVSKDFSIARSMIYLSYRLLKPGGEAIFQIPSFGHFFYPQRRADVYRDKSLQWMEEMEESGLARGHLVEVDEQTSILYMQKFRDEANLEICQKIFGDL